MYSILGRKVFNRKIKYGDTPYLQHGNSPQKSATIRDM